MLTGVVLITIVVKSFFHPKSTLLWKSPQYILKDLQVIEHNDKGTVILAPWLRLAFRQPGFNPLRPPLNPSGMRRYRRC